MNRSLDGSESADGGGLSHAGRAAAVSGGLRGIGRALTEAFLGAGACVTAFHRGGSDEARAAEREMRRLYPPDRLRIAQADIVDPDARARVLEETADAFGRIDILINNAGVCYRDDLTAERTAEQRTINAEAPLQFAREAAEYLRRNPHASEEAPTRGSIVGVSSYVTEWTHLRAEYIRLYGHSKRRLERGLTALARELRPDDINVNVIAVGVVYAGMGMATIGRKEEALRRGELPVSKFASADAVAFEALCLTHPRAHYKTGRVEVLDGGWNLF